MVVPPYYTVSPAYTPSIGPFVVFHGHPASVGILRSRISSGRSPNIK